MNCLRVSSWDIPHFLIVMPEWWLFSLASLRLIHSIVKKKSITTCKTSEVIPLFQYYFLILLIKNVFGNFYILIHGPCRIFRSFSIRCSSLILSSASSFLNPHKINLLVFIVSVVIRYHQSIKNKTNFKKVISMK